MLAGLEPAGKLCYYLLVRTRTARYLRRAGRSALTVRKRQMSVTYHEVTYYDHLPSKPLVEALLEVKWGEANRPDPAYPVIVGRLYEKLKDRYPAIEDLDLAQFPPGLAVQVPRHRFRTADHQWPLVQIGPGIAVLNDTEGYSWTDFRKRALEFFPEVESAHPHPETLGVTSLKLEYIDAVEFDYRSDDIRAFLESKLHLEVRLPQELFDGQPLENRPAHLLAQFAFPTLEPRGRIQLMVSTGRKQDAPAVILHTSVWSEGADAKDGWGRLDEWLDGAHRFIRHWFFALVAGDLLEEFLKS